MYTTGNTDQRPKTHWDGVRNYQARNMMRDEMKLGDLVFFITLITSNHHMFFRYKNAVGRIFFRFYCTMNLIQNTLMKNNTRENLDG